MSARKVVWVVAGILAGATLLFAQPASASNSGDQIVGMTVLLEIQPDSTINVTETIRYDTMGSGHGIWRAIPLWDNLPDGKRQTYEITLGEITQDSHRVQVQEARDSGFLTLRIGNPDVLITGTHEYIISYSIAGAITRTIDDAGFRLAWDAIGNQWDVPINTSTIEVLSTVTPASSQCMYGPAGKTTACVVMGSGRNVTWSVPALEPMQGATVFLNLPVNALTSFIEPNITTRPDFWRDARPGIPTGVGLGLVGSLVVLAVTWRRRLKLVTTPIADFVRFEIPQNLRPAEIAAAWHGNIDTKAFTATVLDLVARRFVRIEPDVKKHITVHRAQVQQPPTAWESQILNAIFRGQESKKLGDFDSRLAAEVKTVGKALTSNAVRAGIRNPAQYRGRYSNIVLSFILFAMTIATVSLRAHPAVFIAALIATVATWVASVAGIWLIPTQQTPESSAFLGEVLGLKRALDTESAADRREFAFRSGLDETGVFATMLPYAVLFGLEKSWIGKFPDLTGEQLSRYGFAYASTAALSSGIQHTAAALSASMSESSAGGGSSGGGGGGGGGGGW